MDAVNGSSLDKLGFDTKKAGNNHLKAHTPDEIDGLKDRAASLKEGVAVAGGADSDGNATVFYSLLADKQEKELEKAAFDGEDTSIVDKAEEPVLEADGDDADDNKNVGAKPQDTLDLGRFGYAKEQVEGWLAQGYSVSDIKNGVAASGENNTKVPNEIAELA